MIKKKTNPDNKALKYSLLVALCDEQIIMLQNEWQKELMTGGIYARIPMKPIAEAALKAAKQASIIYGFLDLAQLFNDALGPEPFVVSYEKAINALKECRSVCSAGMQNLKDIHGSNELAEDILKIFLKNLDKRLSADQIVDEMEEMKLPSLEKLPKDHDRLVQAISKGIGILRKRGYPIPTGYYLLPSKYKQLMGL